MPCFVGAFRLRAGIGIIVWLLLSVTFHRYFVKEFKGLKLVDYIRYHNITEPPTTDSAILPSTTLVRTTSIIPSQDTHELHDVTNSLTIDNDIDNLDAEDIPFLKNYKNPCWYESVSSNYDYSRNRLMSKYKWEDGADRKGIKRMQQIFMSRDSDGENWRLRCLPYFYIAGFSKCGTTDLFTNLFKNPLLSKPFYKEFPYWNWARWRVALNESRYQAANWRRVSPFKHYVDMFDVASENIRTNFTVQAGNTTFHEIITGDGSPSHAWSFPSFRGLKPNNLSKKRGRNLEPEYTIADIIKMLTPKAKIIFIMRDPIERLFSDYFYFQPEAPKSKEEFAELVEKSVRWFNLCFEKYTPRACVYNAKVKDVKVHIRAWNGLYAIYLKDWLKVFPRDQVLVLFLEDYRQRKTELLQEVSEFLGTGIPDAQYFREDELPVNARREEHKSVGDMTARTREVLENFYRPWTKALKTLLESNGFPTPPWPS
ncbi:hypothetical protein CAPTEDRAFT_195662 [Capitella teleta]|uniref:Sulfotransferase domain-containing protein n=1 Tax=Capitella teleta TaxID=283909 RepID=X1ZVC6_CAPTE|nr:hypothetical protein CAPTEDRAFT_195662 [Capitella teleta]|eukprot:ELT88376.1 hypothetical protein CAPTEDRAFT_195662 [Capitella teleta]